MKTGLSVINQKVKQKSLKKYVLFAILCFIGFESYARILIFTTVYNRPDFIEWQYLTFKKFLKDDYEFRVYNDANDPGLERAINAMCARLGITCIRVPQNLHTVDPCCSQAPASFRHGESVQFAFEHSGFAHDDIVFLIDSDEFLLHEFSIREFLGDHDIYILHDHMKPQLCFINMPRLNNPQTINFRAAVLEGGVFADAGYFTRFYLRDHPELKLKQGTMIWGLYRSWPIDLGLDRKKDIAVQLNDKGYTNAEINLIKSIVNLANQTNSTHDADIGFYEKNLFLDYKHGSDWHNPNHAIKARKDKIIREFIYSLL